MPNIRFEAAALQADKAVILRLPEKASRGLPSRGQVAVHAEINGHGFDTVAEPDGEFGHWLKLDKSQQRAAHLKAGESAKVELEPLEQWPEPEVPTDLNAALKGAPKNIQQLWQQITPMARWEWVRWVNATRNPDTRAKRVEVSLSKMKSGKRRPCCFNLASCTDPELSKNGKLSLDEG
ncbi:MAG: YdeI/OmpD-associated family protein [Myxococcaceae bacterium]